MGKKRKASVVIPGDWNAVVGEGRKNKTVGKYGTRMDREKYQIDYILIPQNLETV